MTTKDFDDRALPPGRIDAPPPSAQLLNEIQEMKPVVMRTRFGALTAVAASGLFTAAMVLVRGSHRPDLGALPITWVITAASLWGLSFALPLVAAIVPGREDVLSAPARASRIGGLALAALFLFTLFASVQVPGVSLRPEDAHMSLLHSCFHCAGFIFKMAALPFLIVGAFLLRGLAPVGGARIGMALGVAGGALGGLVLVFICPFAGTAHVVLGHVGGTILVAGIGAALVLLVNRRAARTK